jgi:hypothetical protein
MIAYLAIVIIAFIKGAEIHEVRVAATDGNSRGSLVGGSVS